MNDDMIQGEGRDLGGKLRETAGDLTGDRGLQANGIGDQLAGKAQKVVGSLKDTFAEGGAPLIDRAKGFAKARPFAAAALAGVLGIALLNTLRGKK